MTAGPDVTLDRGLGLGLEAANRSKYLYILCTVVEEPFHEKKADGKTKSYLRN